MNKNMGKTDKIVRWVVALLLIILFATGVLKGGIGIVLLIFAGVLITGTFVGVCPLYYPLGIDTRSKEEANNP